MLFRSEETVVLLTTGDKGAGALALRAAEKVNKLIQPFLRHDDINIKSFAIPEENFSMASGYSRNLDIIDREKPDVIFAFVDDPDSSAGTKHLLELAQERGIPSYYMRKYC